MLPNAPEILAKASAKLKIPYTLSTVSTAGIENIAKASEGTFWFQLYHPTEDRLRDDILDRLKAVECPVLVRRSWEYHIVTFSNSRLDG